jgi:hypothetical protein
MLPPDNKIAAPAMEKNKQRMITFLPVKKASFEVDDGWLS